VVREVHEVLGRMRQFAERIRFGGSGRAHTGPADPEHRQRRHRRLRPRPGHGVRGAALLLHGASLTFRFRPPTWMPPTFVEATREPGPPRRRCSIISSKTFGTLETLTNATSGPGLGGAGTRRRIRGGPSTSWPSRPTPNGSAAFGIDTREHVSAFWDWVGGRYSMDSRDRPVEPWWRSARERFRRDAGRLPRDGRALPHRPAGAEPAGPDGACSGVWYRDFFGAQTVGVMPYEQYLKAVPGLPPAS